MRITHGLGTVGLKFKSGIYIDMFRKPHFGMFLTDCKQWKVWVNFREGTIRTNQRELGYVLTQRELNQREGLLSKPVNTGSLSTATDVESPRSLEGL